MGGLGGEVLVVEQDSERGFPFPLEKGKVELEEDLCEVVLGEEEGLILGGKINK